MANLITFTGPFDEQESTRTFNGDLVSGLAWNPGKSSTQTRMMFTDGTMWVFDANEAKTANLLNTLVATIASPGNSKKLTFAPSIVIKNISIAGGLK